jgi:peptidyl-prolyl cis-trans isomerase C
MRRAALFALVSSLTVVSAGITVAALAQRADPTRPPPTHAPGTPSGARGAAAASKATTTPPTKVPTPDDPAPVARGPEDEERRSHVIARIGTVTITVGEVEDQIARQAPFMRARYRQPEQLRELVQSMVRLELLAREADRQRFGDDPEVRDATAQAAVQQLIRERFDERITPESMAESDVRAYYAAHPEEFTRPEMRRASHILVATREAAQEIAQETRTADARAFREIAQTRSLDAESRARGGDLRYFDAEGHGPNAADAVVDTALVRAAFALGDVGDVSPPVQVGDQFSVVKLTGRRPAEHRSVEEAGPSIRLRIWRERRQQAIDSFVDGLRQRAAVEVFYERMAPIRMDPPARVSEDDDPAALEARERAVDEGSGGLPLDLGATPRELGLDPDHAPPEGDEEGPRE